VPFRAKDFFFSLYFQYPRRLRHFGEPRVVSRTRRCPARTSAGLHHIETAPFRLPTSRRRTLPFFFERDENWKPPLAGAPGRRVLKYPTIIGCPCSFPSRCPEGVDVFPLLLFRGPFKPVPFGPASSLIPLPDGTRPAARPPPAQTPNTCPSGHGGSTTVCHPTRPRRTIDLSASMVPSFICAYTPFSPR